MTQPEPTGRCGRLFREETIGSSLGMFLPTTVVARGTGMIRGVVLAWLISNTEFGLLQISMLVVHVLHPICGFGLHEAIARYVPHYESRGSLRPFLARAVPLALGASVILSFIAGLAARPLGHAFFTTLQGREVGATTVAGLALARVAVCATLATIAYFVILAVVKGLRMFRAVSLMEFSQSVGFTVAAVSVALLGGRTAFAVMVVYTFVTSAVAIGMAIPLLVMIWTAKRLGGVPENVAAAPGTRRVFDQLWRFSIWVALAALLWQIIQQYPMWYLHKICGGSGEVTAVFGGARLLSQAILILAVAIITVVQTSVTKTWESRGREPADRQWRLGFKVSAVFLLIVCTGIVAGRDLLIRIYPTEYAGGAAIMPILLLFFLVSGHLLFLGIHFHLIERTRHLVFPWLMGVVCSVAAGMQLVRPGLSPSEGLSAASWSGVVGISVALVACLWLIVAERRPLDIGSWILLAACYVLALPTSTMITAVVLLVFVSGTTSLVFSHEEKGRLYLRLTDGLESLRHLRQSWRRG